MTAYEAIMFWRDKVAIAKASAGSKDLLLLEAEYPPWEAFLMLVCAGWPLRMAWAIANGGNPVGPPVLSPAPTELGNLQTICKRA